MKIAKRNLLARDMLLAAHLKEQVPRHGYTLVEVDGTHSPDELTNLIEQHFALFLSKLKADGPTSQGA